MKTRYYLTCSYIQSVSNKMLPMTLKTKFRSWESVTNAVRKLTKEGRNVCICEFVDDKWVATYEYEAGTGRYIFDCDEDYCDKLDQIKVV